MTSTPDNPSEAVSSDPLDGPSSEPGDGEELEALIAAIPEGWSRARIGGQSWGVTRKTHAGGNVISLDAERLGTAEALGANVWITSGGALLRPCEIPAEAVWRFLRDATHTVPLAQPGAAD